MDTLIAENFIYEQTLDKTVPDSDRVVFKQKNITPIIDNARGGSEYISGKVVIDAQNFGNGPEIPDWANAYVVFPEVEKLTGQAGNADMTVAALPTNFLTAPKNNALVESFRAEQGGNMVVSESQNLSQLVNFKKHCTTSADDIAKNAATTLYAPDGVGNWAATASIAGVSNVGNNPNGTVLTGAEQFNAGVLQRQRAGLPLNAVSTVFNDATKQANEFAPYQKITSAVTTIATASATTLSEIHRARVVYLRDLDDYFAKHPLVRGCGYKFTFTVNQGSAVATYSSITTTQFATLPTLTAATLTGPATCMPSMLVVGPNTVAGAGATTIGTTSSLTLTLSSKLDISSDARQQGVMLYVPTYIPTEEYEARLLQSPQVYRTPFKITSSVFTGLTANAPINLQLFTAIANPRALVVIPQFAQETQTQPSQCSPLNPSPACTDPTLSLTKCQIRVNARPVLPAPQSYGFQQFIENTSRIFAVNGGLSPITSGVIDFWKFMHNYRYYAFDLSYLAEEQRDIPQLVSFESFNNNSVKIDLYVYCLSEQGAIFDMVKGGVELK